MQSTPFLEQWKKDAEDLMSKLAHSDQATMDELDRKRAIADGNEDLLCGIEAKEMTPLEDAIELAKGAGGDKGYRAYQGCIFIGANESGPDADFKDYGLARATVEILNAVCAGKLVPA